MNHKQERLCINCVITIDILFILPGVLSALFSGFLTYNYLTNTGDIKIALYFFWPILIALGIYLFLEILLLVSNSSFLLKPPRLWSFCTVYFGILLLFFIGTLLYFVGFSGEIEITDDESNLLPSLVVFALLESPLISTPFIILSACGCIFSAALWHSTRKQRQSSSV